MDEIALGFAQLVKPFKRVGPFGAAEPIQEIVDYFFGPGLVYPIQEHRPGGRFVFGVSDGSPSPFSLERF